MPNQTSPQERFAAYQQKRRQQLWALLGDLPPKRPPVAHLLRIEKGPGYTLEHLELELNGLEPVPALLLVPERRPQPAAGLLYIHSHGDNYDLGKEELLRGLNVMKPYAPVCVEKGLVTLAIDSWCFSGRKHKPDGRRGEHDTFKLMLWRGQVLWGMMLFDEYQAVSYLQSRPEVDPGRIGAFGISMGSTKAWWLAALDPRVRLCANLCCLTDYEELIRADHLAGHGIYYYVPELLKHFQAHEICELIVPRPHLSLNGSKDPLTPPAGVERIREHLASLYAQYGRPEDLRIELFDCGHEETPAMRGIVLEWLETYLARAPGLTPQPAAG
ncbi:MAG: dienelactone hydrolase family protein [Thermoguttaceae bacterium]